jgi:uncharacterized protein YaaQ
LIGSTPALIDRLMVVVVQEQDVESAISALTKLGISITTLSSSGAFLSRRNATLLIGLATGQERAIVRALRNSCRRRVEYLTTALETAIPVLPPPIPVNVGGATIFTFEVERFEGVFSPHLSFDLKAQCTAGIRLRIIGKILQRHTQVKRGPFWEVLQVGHNSLVGLDAEVFEQPADILTGGIIHRSNLQIKKLSLPIQKPGGMPFNGESTHITRSGAR